MLEIPYTGISDAFPIFSFACVTLCEDRAERKKGVRIFEKKGRTLFVETTHPFLQEDAPFPNKGRILFFNICRAFKRE